jgi:MFS family permease
MNLRTVTSQLREAAGLPNVSGRRAVLAAAVIDSLGSGLFLPFAVLYFLRTTALPLATVGVGLSAGTAAVIAVVPLAGMAVDRFGAVRCVVAANLLQAAGFLGYLWVSTLWQLAVFTLLVGAGRRLFWTANGGFVALVSGPGEQTRWFALLRALRNGGLALGGALAAAGAAAGTQTAYHLLVAGNVASFVLAALLMARWGRTAASAGQPSVRTRPSGSARRHPPRRGRAGYRAVLADHPFVLLVAATFVFVLCGLAIDVLLTVYVTGPLHRPAWLASLLFTVNGLLVVTAQTAITRSTERYPRTRMLHLSTALWAAAFLLLWALTVAPAGAVVPGLLAALLAFTAAEIVCMPILNSLALALAPAEQRGRYFAVQGLTWVGPQAIAPAAFTWLLAHGTAWPWITLITACAVSTGLLARLRRALPASIDQPGRRPARIPTTHSKRTGAKVVAASAMAGPDPYDYARRLAAESLTVGDPIGWFERLYAQAEAGEASVPWGGSPHRLLVDWAETNSVEGRGRRAMVVGCGLGDDAEYVAGLGFDTVAFDVAGSAIRAARRRFPKSAVRYVVADLLDPAPEWRQSFDLVVEVLTLQVLPDPQRRHAISQIGQMVRRGGTLIVIARAAGASDDRHPPWPLTRAQIEDFAATGLHQVRIENLPDPETSAVHRWRAEFAGPDPERPLEPPPILASHTPPTPWPRTKTRTETTPHKASTTAPARSCPPAPRSPEP